jgi:hypothetical protein
MVSPYILNMRELIVYTSLEEVWQWLSCKVRTHPHDFEVWKHSHTQVKPCLRSKSIAQ